jgi:hypothetical protein
VVRDVDRFEKMFLKCQSDDLLALLLVNAWVKIQIEARSLRACDMRTDVRSDADW